MENTNVKRVLYAINHALAEKQLSRAIKDLGEKVNVVGTVVSHDSLLDFLSTKKVDVLVYSDRLPGKENSFDFLMRLRHIHKELRIVLIANEMNKGDIRLATLVAYGLWDITYGDGIPLSEVAKKVVNPSTYEQASMHLPDDVDWIKFDGGRKSKSANDLQDQIRLLTKQLGEANKARAAADEHCAEIEAHCRDVEFSNSTLQAEHSRQLLAQENKFIEEKSVLSDRIAVLVDEKDTAQSMYEKASKSHEEIVKKYDSLMEKTNAESNAQKAEIEKLEHALAEKEEASQKALSQKEQEYYAELSRKETEYKEELKKKDDAYNTLLTQKAADTSSAEQRGKDILADAEKEREAILAEANAKVSQMLADAENKSAQLVSDAENKSSQLVSDAENKSREMLEDATTKSKQMIDEADAHINLSNEEKIRIIDETAAKSKQLIDEAEQKLASSSAMGERIVEDAKIRSQEIINEADIVLSRARLESEASERTLAEATERAKNIIAEAEEKAGAMRAEAERFVVQKGEVTFLTPEEVEKRLKNRYKPFGENEKCMADIAFEETKKQAKIDEMNSTIEMLEKHKQNLEGSIESVREKISDERKKLDDELASYETLLADTRTQKEKELEELAKEYIARAAVARDMHAEEDKKMVEAAQAETDRKLKSIDSAFAYEKKRLARDFEKYKNDIDEEKKAYALENRVSEYKFDINNFDISSGCYSRCVPLMCIGTMPGSGVSSVALNTAMMLAIRGAKTLYVEFDSRNPTFITNMLANNLKESLDPCMSAIADGSFDAIDNNIISKQKMINADLSAKRKDLHERLPDMLHYMAFNTDKNIKNHTTVDLIKALVTYVAGKKGYKYIVCDIPGWMTREDLADLYQFCNDHIIVMNQDHVTIKRTDKLLKLTEDFRKGNHAITDVYVMNKNQENANLTVGRARDILKLEEIISIPMNLGEFLLGASNGLPPVLFSKNNEFCAKMKIITDRFKG